MILLYQRIQLLLILLFLTTISYAQTVQSVEAKIVEDDLVVTYKVSGINSTQLFDVELLSSHDKFQTPITGAKIQGKVGSRIALDASNDIVIKDPLDVVKGVTNISFRVRVKMVYFPVTVSVPGTPFSQKMKKDIDIAWRGGLKGEQVKFDLYRYDEKVLDDIFVTTNTGTAEFKVPKIPKGKGPDYIMKMEFASMPAPVELPSMKLKPKKSAAARIIKWTILLGGAYYVYEYTDLIKKTTPPPNPSAETLPDAPGPPGSFLKFSFGGN